MNLLSKIFNRNKEIVQPFDFSRLNSDLHSHLIPGIDDGAKTMDESIFLINQLMELGYKKIITTPHVQNDLYKNSPKNILEGFELLKSELKKRNLSIEIECAAEYLVDDGLREKIERDEILSFSKKKVLIELPYLYEPPNLNEILFELQVRGYSVVLAHPERYVYWHKQIDKFENLCQRNIKLQLNINSLTGWYSFESKKMAESLIDKKLISYLGSDLHNLNYLNELKKSALFPYLHKAFDENSIQNMSL